MSQNKVFHQILRHFTHEFANGDLIRKYAERSYSVEEIRQHLDFPTPKEEIHKIAWTHLLSTKQILLERPDHEEFGKYEYVKDVSPYGRVSYRKVKIASEMSENSFCEQPCSLSILQSYLADPDQIIYVELPFGIIKYKDKEMYQKMLSMLEQREAAYIESMFLERKYVYYKLNHKMEKILRKLMVHDLYQGKSFLQVQLSP